MKYAIQDTTLTAIGDAIRDKRGYIGFKTKEEAQPFFEFEVNTTLMEAPEYRNSNYWYVYKLADYNPDIKPIETKNKKIYVEFDYEPLEENPRIRLARFDNGTAKTQYSNDCCIINNNDGGIHNPRTITFDKNLANLYLIIQSYTIIAVKLRLRIWVLDANDNYLGKSVELLTPSEMVEEINQISVIPENLFLLSGDCSGMFQDGYFDWFLELGKNKITTTDLTDIDYMFQNSQISEIPFELNCNGAMNGGYVFNNCSKLKVAPKINNLSISSSRGIEYMFYGSGVEEIPEGYGANWNWDYLHQSTQSKHTTNVFGTNHRRIAPDFLREVWNRYMPVVSGQYLTELIKYPIPRQNVTYTSMPLFTTSQYGWYGFNLPRLRRFVFDTNENGEPYKVQWAKIYISFSSSSSNSFGVVYNPSNPDTYGPHRIVDDETYQLYKDLEDAWTSIPEYGFYNHNSAVETINSLPDTAEFVATNGNANTIAFKGAFGALTDGGAINTLTEEEIAVAVAKGWTVTLS